MKFFKLKFILVTVFFIIIYSCNDDDSNTEKIIDFGIAPTKSIITTGSVNVITEKEVRYHTINFTSAPYTVTIIETEKNIVIVDLGPAPNFAIELKSYVDVINKPGAVIITHNHGDHYGGAGSFTDLDFYAEKVVASQLNNKDTFTAIYSKSVIGIEGSEVIGDLEFIFDKVSNAETGENGYLYNKEHQALFSGDLVYNKTHAYIREYTPKDGEDEIDNWIAGLNALKAKFSGYKHLFVGHNGSRSDIRSAIDENIEYLQNAKGIIKGTQTIFGGSNASNSQEVVDELKLLYPNHNEGGLLLSLPGSFGPGDPGADLAWF